MALPIHAPRSRVIGGTTGDVDDGELTLLGEGIVGGQPGDRLTGGQPTAQQFEPVRAVTEVGQRLSGDRPDLGAAPWHGVADGQALRRHGDTPRARCRIERND